MSETAVRQMFNAFTSGNWKTMNYTREKAYHVWSDFWFLLISSGFAFEKTDLVDIKKYCHESSWNPSWRGIEENHYSLAVRCGNLTFAYACEKLWDRKPFIGIGLDYYDCCPNFSNHATKSKSQGRLVLHTQFTWKGEYVKVTSFNDKEHSLIACSYHPDPEGYTPSKIKKRFRITVEEFKKEMSKRKKAAIAAAEGKQE